jgi:hypothetical protein
VRQRKANQIEPPGSRKIFSYGFGFSARTGPILHPRSENRKAPGDWRATRGACSGSVSEMHS